MDSTLKKYLAIYLEESSKETPTVYCVGLNEGGTPYKDASNILQNGVFAPTNRRCELLVILRMLVDQNYTLLDDYLVQMIEETDEPEVEPNDLFAQRFNIIAVENDINEEHIYNSDLSKLVYPVSNENSQKWRTRRPNIT